MSFHEDFQRYRNAFFFCEYAVNPELYFESLGEREKAALIERMKIAYKENITDKQYMRLREAEYPGWKEFMNEFFDGDVENIRRVRNEIKAKYPKPV